MLHTYRTSDGGFDEEYRRYVPLLEMEGASQRFKSVRMNAAQLKLAKRRSRVMRHVAAAMLAGLLCAAAIASAVVWTRRRKAKERVRQRKMQACALEMPGDTVFVCLACRSGSAECAHLLRSLFARARCPSRIFVGMCCLRLGGGDACDAGDERGEHGIVGQYMTLVGQHNDPFALADHVRVLSAASDSAGGYMGARRLCELQLYGGERFVLHVGEQTVFASDWDRILIDELATCADARAVLTTLPQIYMYDQRHSNVTDAPSEPTYPTLERIDEYGMPHMALRVCGGKALQPFPVCTWHHCLSFARSDLLREAPSVSCSDAAFDADGEDFVFGARAWSRGWNFYAPTRVPLYARYDRAECGYEVAHEHKRSTYLSIFGAVGRHAMGSVRSARMYLDHVGLRPESQMATPHAFLGLGARADNDEITTKYGSFSEYYSSLRAAGGHVRV